jgi:hypothetical protein
MTVRESSTSDGLSGTHVVARPNDATFKVGPTADVSAREQNATLHGGPGMHPAALPDSDAPREGDAASDRGVPLEHHSP